MVLTTSTFSIRRIWQQGRSISLWWNLHSSGPNMDVPYSTTPIHATSLGTRQSHQGRPSILWRTMSPSVHPSKWETPSTRKTIDLLVQTWRRILPRLTLRVWSTLARLLKSQTQSWKFWMHSLLPLNISPILERMAPNMEPSTEGTSHGQPAVNSRTVNTWVALRLPNWSITWTWKQRTPWSTATTWLLSSLSAPPSPLSSLGCTPWREQCCPRTSSSTLSSSLSSVSSSKWSSFPLRLATWTRVWSLSKSETNNSQTLAQLRCAQ